MTHAAERYPNGVIYRLVNDVDDSIYVGSTCVPLHKRLYWHKKAARRNPERHVYKHLNEIGWESVQIILVEKYPCACKKELLARERYWIEKLKPDLNKCIPTRTSKEWCEANKDQIAQRKKEYREANKEVIAQKTKEYYEKNKDKVSQRQKEYYENNKDKISQKDKEYRENNKDKIAQKRKEKITCECGSEVRKDSLNRHKHTNKHIAFVKQREEIKQD